MQKRGLIVLLCLILLLPSGAKADSYDGPYCFEDKNDTVSPDFEGIRGTCREVAINHVIVLTPDAEKEYFIGTHEPIGYNCDRGGCSNQTTYSEKIQIQSSSTLVISDLTKADYVPLEAAVFNRSFFRPLLLQQFQKQGFPFNENNFPVIAVSVFEKGELEKVKQGEGYYFPEDQPLNTLQLDYGFYSLVTLSNVEYGKYIWAPRGTLAESQYAHILKNEHPKTNEELGITLQWVHHVHVPIVSLTNPLRSITAHWEYSLRDGKPVLSWQKTEYALKDGSVKTTVAPAAEQANTAVPQDPTVKKMGFWEILWNKILSWFK
jgi:hypothetical protein